jgi:hypothetical protein
MLFTVADKKFRIFVQRKRGGHFQFKRFARFRTGVPVSLSQEDYTLGMERAFLLY